MIINSPLFIFLCAFLVIAGFFLFKRRRSPSLIFSNKNLFEGIKPSFKVILTRNIFLLRLFSLFFVILALMRPQLPLKETKITTEGIDIVLAIDVSGSMLAKDFKVGQKTVDRLTAVKKVVEEFIKKRTNDRIGLVAFAGRAYVVSPLTLDKGWLLENLERLKVGTIEDGTAIGMGIVASLNRLKNSPSKSKVIILLSDGRNNAGEIPPSLASEMAHSLGVRIYTVGAGSKELAPYPFKDFFGNIVYKPIKIEIDEETLKKVAQDTGGLYFRAEDFESLRKTYQEIDKMEKTPFKERGYAKYKELSPNFLKIAFILLLGELILKNTFLRRLP